MNKTSESLFLLMKAAKEGKKVCIATADGFYDITFRKIVKRKGYSIVLID